ncbi:MAG TPA: hypothetical protein VFF06_12830 [Polyangia bacterium]|nr:hypothetical protein [Polyangia bacterium]
MRRLVRRLGALAAVLAGAACGGCSPSVADANGVSALYGEVHVHQFPGGVHPAALFLRQAVAADGVTGDSVVPTAALPSRVEGPCTLTLPSTCAPPCGPVPAFADGGAVHVRGGHSDGDVTLAFDAATENYAATPPLARGAAIFSGGEMLSVSGDGAEAPAFSGSVRAPVPLALAAPAQPLAAANGVTVAWTPDQSDRIAISLVASTTDGRFAVLQCFVADAPGSFALPSSLLAALPAPPRDLQLEVSRDFLAHVPSVKSSDGVVVHAGWAVTVTGHED